MVVVVGVAAVNPKIRLSLYFLAIIIMTNFSIVVDGGSGRSSKSSASKYFYCCLFLLR